MSENQPVVLVTGANGFVGRHLSPALARDGWTVRRAVRHSSGNAEEVVIESIGADTDWSAALSGIDAVVHLAARVHHPHEEHATELYQSVNTEGTLHLARCAAQAAVRHFVFVSTVLVHGRNSDGRAPLSEKDSLRPRGIYASSKAAAEAGLETIAHEVDMNITVVRPPLIYGSGAKGNFALLATAVKRDVPLPFASIANRRAFLSVENLVSFISRRLGKADGKFDVFLVADAEQVSTPEFIRKLARAAGKSSHLFPMPTSLLRALLVMIGRREAQDSLIGSLEVDLSKAIATGWRPEIPLDQGLKHALSGDDYQT